MNKKEKSESVFIFLREAENKKMIGTETGEAKANLDTFLEKLIADAVYKRRNYRKGSGSK